MTISNSDGTGVTDDRTLDLSINAAIRLTNEIMEGLSAVDLRAAYIECHHRAPRRHPRRRGLSIHRPRGARGLPRRCGLLLDEGIVPVIPACWVSMEKGAPTGSIPMRRPWRWPRKCPRRKSFTSAPRPPELLRAALVVPETQEILKKRPLELAPGVAFKLGCAARACVQGVPRVHILDGGVNEALLTEIFSHEGFGTMIYSNGYQQVRGSSKRRAGGDVPHPAIGPERGTWCGARGRRFSRSSKIFGRPWKLTARRSACSGSAWLSRGIRRRAGLPLRERGRMRTRATAASSGASWKILPKEKGISASSRSRRRPSITCSRRAASLRWAAEQLPVARRGQIRGQRPKSKILLKTLAP